MVNLFCNIFTTSCFSLFALFSFFFQTYNLFLFVGNVSSDIVDEIENNKYVIQFLAWSVIQNKEHFIE